MLLNEYMNFNSIPFIVELSLGDNFITGEGAIVLANNIRKCGMEVVAVGVMIGGGCFFNGLLLFWGCVVALF